MIEEVTEKTTEGPTTQADAILEAAKGSFTALVVIGKTPDGGFDFATNVPQYPVMHWFLQRAVFELNLHEHETRQKELAAAAIAAATVAEAPAKAGADE